MSELTFWKREACRLGFLAPRRSVHGFLCLIFFLSLCRAGGTLAMATICRQTMEFIHVTRWSAYYANSDSVESFFFHCLFHVFRRLSRTGTYYWLSSVERLFFFNSACCSDRIWTTTPNISSYFFGEQSIPFGLKMDDNSQHLLYLLQLSVRLLTLNVLGPIRLQASNTCSNMFWNNALFKSSYKSCDKCISYWMKWQSS